MSSLRIQRFYSTVSVAKICRIFVPASIPRIGVSGDKRLLSGVRSFGRANAAASPPVGRDSLSNDVKASKSIKENVNEPNATPSIDGNKTFREDFRGTRVFVQGLPLNTTWQALKDHFKIAGSVVYASVSKDPQTGELKGHGIVQYETTEMAKTAIATMRDHPLDGCRLFVREDVQVNPFHDRKKSLTPASEWRCGNNENNPVDEKDRRAILQMIDARLQARQEKDFEAADAVREELNQKYGVQLNDRIRMWWTGGKVQDERFLELLDWRQIPSSPRNDARVDPNRVNALLQQRDIARRQKNFAAADALLEQAMTAPDGNWSLKINDESRTWRIWSVDPRSKSKSFSP